MLVHLQTLATKGQLPIRVDLRVRNKHGVPIYDRDSSHGPLPGMLMSVNIKRRGFGRTARKYLEWFYEPDPGVTVPSPTPGFARVVLGPTSGNYYLEVLEDPPAQSPSAPPRAAP